MGSKDAVESVRHWHPNFCSPQLLEGLCIQDEQESTLVLQEEEKGRVSVQAELLSTVLAHRGTSRPWRLNLWDRSTATHRFHLANTDIPRKTPTCTARAWPWQSNTPWGARNYLPGSLKPSSGV